MPTWQQLRDLKLSEYTDAADGWGKVSNRANTAKDRVDNEMLARIRDSQKGAAATAAVADLGRLSRNYQYLHTECGLIRTALNSLASELTAPQKKLRQALEDAENLKFTVQPDGSVEYPTTVPIPMAPGKGSTNPARNLPLLPTLTVKDPAAPDPHKAKAEDIAARIAAAVREASEIDGRFASVLRKLKATPGLDITDAMLVDAAADTRAVQQAAGKYLDDDKIPKGKSPAENKKWWNALTQEQREEYATLYPASIGALNGIPATVRDDANRMVLAETRAQVQIERDKLAASEPPKGNVYVEGRSVRADWRAWDEKRAALDAQLKGMNAIQDRFDRTGHVQRPGERPLPEAYLLGFDIKGNGHAIVANGNPDTADHTNVYVPGLTSRLEIIDEDLPRSETLWGASDAMADGRSVSTITWLGYDAPQSLLDAPRSSFANNGGPLLNSFVDGLRTTHEGDPTHLTVQGHSYGSTVVGSACRQGTLRADDIFVVGSPGMQYGHADDLDVPSGHVWAGKTWDDLVPGVGGPKHGGLHNELPADSGDPNMVIVTPDDEEFGAHRISTEGSSGHSGYWDPGTPSLLNQARVTVGKYDKVTLDD
ncbi:hypothetical protein GCM10020367_30280 [Streptomyces sannanensis]|uniref:DUF1023 domain-containing protein n=1 Tax=Streptomyces sannanensis TaxID=285536 RepID=A0ABP6SBP7_9ACTN